MLELAELILKKVGGKSKIVHRDLPADDPKQRQPDITLAKKFLDWQPTVPLEQGIEKTIDYFRGEI
jgi:UDP-glucuronate decarboxylase